MENTGRKERVFQNLLNMTYQPLIVGKNKSMVNKKDFSIAFPTIFSALNHVEDKHSVIKVNPGLYNERITIKKNNIKIQASQISQNSILINDEFFNIIIDLPQPEDKVIIESLKIANACENAEKHEIINQDFLSLKSNSYKGFKIGPSLNCCIYVKRGILQLDQCKVSMAAHNNPQILVPCIVVEKEGTIILNRSEVKGGEGTIGILSKNGGVSIKQSIIKDHGAIGVLSIGNKSTNLCIKNSSVSQCHEGVVACGPFSGMIQSNIFCECGNSGIVIYQGNKITVVENQILKCDKGIEIRNGLPSILKNNIWNCSSFGIECIATNSYLCKATIKFNDINENAKGGILIQGTLNQSNLIGNTLKHNNLMGIKVRKRANPNIFMNKILKTLGDGIYITESSMVFLEKNQIIGSLKSNLVLEGPNNIYNFIYENKIESARGQGIFTIHGQKFFIKSNIISHNYNGIVSTTGVQTIQTNKITSNQRNGILLIHENNNMIQKNTITQNKRAGIFIRNNSVCTIKDNNFSRNKYQIVIENDDPRFNELEENNQFEGNYEIRIPRNYKCQLI